MVLKAFKANDNKVVGEGNGRANKMVINLSKNEKSRNLIHVSNIGAMTKSNFLISNVKKVFNYL